MSKGELSRALTELGHPYKLVALARVDVAKGREGYGLTKIPDRVLDKFNEELLEALPYTHDRESINSTAMAEAQVLTLIDALTIEREGLNESIQQYHVEGEGIDKKYITSVTTEVKGRRRVGVNEGMVDPITFYQQEILPTAEQLHEEYGSNPNEGVNKLSRLINKFIRLSVT